MNERMSDPEHMSDQSQWDDDLLDAIACVEAVRNGDPLAMGVILRNGRPFEMCPILAHLFDELAEHLSAELDWDGVLRGGAECGARWRTMRTRDLVKRAGKGDPRAWVELLAEVVSGLAEVHGGPDFDVRTWALTRSETG
jgi:hypothetical protein